MPYRKFITYKDGKKKYAIQNTNTGKITRYSSEKKRETGIRMREMYSHGFTPTKVKDRHTGKYRCRTPRGKIVFKNRPLHTQTVKKKGLFFGKKEDNEYDWKEDVVRQKIEDAGTDAPLFDEGEVQEWTKQAKKDYEEGKDHTAESRWKGYADDEEEQ
jgi:hypothetical protein